MGFDAEKKSFRKKSGQERIYTIVRRATGHSVLRRAFINDYDLLRRRYLIEDYRYKAAFGTTTEEKHALLQQAELERKDYLRVKNDLGKQRRTDPLYHLTRRRVDSAFAQAVREALGTTIREQLGFVLDHIDGFAEPLVGVHPRRTKESI